MSFSSPDTTIPKNQFRNSKSGRTSGKVSADQLVSGKVLPHWVVAASQRGIAIDEEVEPWEGYQVDALLSHVSVELPRKAEGAGDS